MMVSRVGMLAALALLVVVVVVPVSTAIPVYVMLPLDTVGNDLQLTDPDTLQSQLEQLAGAGVEGVMTDCWWGLVEGESPQKYDFSPYEQLADMVQDAGLKMQVVMSFHRCGGNVGDDCDIPLPSWVLDSFNDGNEIFYVDNDGNSDSEYLQLWVDNDTTIFTDGRAPLDVYEDFMSAFKSAMGSRLGSTIVEVQVGTGPAGEMRYPSYQSDKWTFCGVGEFQCYSSQALADFQAAAADAGHPEWTAPPDDAGNYNSVPSDTSFFTNTYTSDYGQFFLGWYKDALLSHGEQVLARAKSVFAHAVDLSVKVAGIHWWYFDDSHAAELTAGYYNIPGTSDVYGDIASMLQQYDATFDFTCLEMQDSEQPAECDCGPHELVDQTKLAAINAAADYSGENALPRYDTTAYNTIKDQATVYGVDIDRFTYLRLSSDLFEGDNWTNFVQFVSDMMGL